AAALAGAPVTRMVDEDAPHDLRRPGEELGTRVELHAALLDQPHERLVDERGAAQRVAVALVPQVAPREVPQLLVHQRHQVGEGALVALGPAMQQAGDAGDATMPRRCSAGGGNILLGSIVCHAHGRLPLASYENTGSPTHRSTTSTGGPRTAAGKIGRAHV